MKYNFHLSGTDHSTAARSIQIEEDGQGTELPSLGFGRSHIDGQLQSNRPCGIPNGLILQENDINA